MDRDRFWSLIDKSREESDGSLQSQTNCLFELLLTQSAAEIASFQQFFDECMDRVYHWDIWAAAYIACRGCGDDAFMDFCAGLIAMGKNVFEAACKNVESLVDAFEERPAFDWLEEGILYVPRQAFEQKSDGDLPPRYQPAPDGPAGIPWEESSQELSERFPRLWSRFEVDQSEHTSRQESPEQTGLQSKNRRPWWKFWR